MKSLTTPTRLFFFTDYSQYAVLVHYYSNEISDQAKYIFLSSLTTLTALFYFTTIKIQSVTTLTTLFYFHYY